MILDEFVIEKPEKIFIDCEIHGDNSEALINGTCRLCRDEESKNKYMVKIEKSFINKKRDSGVMERYLDFNLDNYPIDNENQAMLLKSLKSYEFDKNIVLLGRVGTGKTRLACSLIDKAIKNDISCYYAKYYQLMKMSIEDKIKFKQVINSRFLVIDEFGVSETDNKTNLLFEIFDQRYDNLLPTMIISNFSANIFKDKIGDSLHSRIKQYCISFNCDWGDYRLKGV